MRTLWHCPDARSFRVLWALEELGLDYRLEILPFPPRVRSPAFLEVNPLGTIPYYTEPGGIAMTESSAIVHWLAAGRGPTALSVEPDCPDHALWLNHLYQSDATLTFPQTIVFRYRVLEPEERRQPMVADDYARWFLARTRWLEQCLSDGRAWLVANRFTAADIAQGYAFLLAGHLGLLGEVAPTILDWWARCQQRDGFKRAKAAQAPEG